MEHSEENLVQISKFLSYILRHKPEVIDLQLDDSGWVSISELLSKADKKLSLTRPLIDQTVASSDKQRFQISDDGLRIRANQGHSIKVDLQLVPKKPPFKLFHGTATRFLESIKNEGLIAGKRQHVHLSEDINTAITVGKRYGEPIVLEINTISMHQRGHEFFLSTNGVWLTDSVPAKYFHKVD